MIHCISSVNVPWTLPSHRLIITIKELPSDTRLPTISSHTRPSQLLATVALLHPSPISPWPRPAAQVARQPANYIAASFSGIRSGQFSRRSDDRGKKGGRGDRNGEGG